MIKPASNRVDDKSGVKHYINKPGVKYIMTETELNVRSDKPSVQHNKL